MGARASVLALALARARQAARARHGQQVAVGRAAGMGEGGEAVEGTARVSLCRWLGRWERPRSRSGG